MNRYKLLDAIFGEDVGSVSLFCGSEETLIRIDSYNTVEQAVETLEEPCVDLMIDDELYAVAYTEYLDNASVYLKNENKTISVFFLDPPCAPDAIPDHDETALTEIPLYWNVEKGTMDFCTIEDLYAAPVRDADDDETIDSDVVDDVEPDAVDEPQIEKFNDADVIGVPDPEMSELFAKNVVFMSGELYDQGDRRNTPAGKWKRQEMTWGTLLLHPNHGLTVHPEAKTKHGRSIVPAETLDGQRNAESVKAMYAIVLDIDSGPSVDQVAAKLVEHNIFAVIYTSFNHNKTEIELKHDDVIRKLKIKDSPNRSQIQTYLREHSKDRYDESFIQKIEIVEARRQTANGLRVVLRTPPLEKFRVVMPLWEPVELTDLGTTVSEYKDAWANKVTGLVVNMLGVSFDSTSCDVNRLFYTPRHKKGSDWRSLVVQGKPLRFEDIKPSSKDAYLRNRAPVDDDPFSYDSQRAEGEVPQCLTPSNKFLNKWHTDGGKHRLLLPQLIEAEAPDKVRRHVSEGKIEIECPFEHEHSTEGGTGTVVMDPLTNENEYWTVSCPHDSCQGRHKLEHLEEMLRAGWFEESLIYDPSDYLLHSEEGENSEEQEEESEEEQKKTFLDEAKELGDHIDDEQIQRLFRRMVRLEAGNVETAKVLEHLAKKTSLTRADLKRILKRITTELSVANSRENTELVGSDHIPDVTRWGFGDCCEYARRRIQDENARSPRLFYYMEELARIDENADGRPVIKLLSERQFGAELNSITKWQKPLGEDSMIEISAPSDVVQQIYYSPRKGFPILRGLVTTPIFTKSGNIILSPGYHEESNLFYAPNRELDIPKISDEPTEDEVFESKQLLIEEVFADFPLGGYKRDEIVKYGLHGDGIPAVANCVGLVLLLFCRDMIEGPTPGHLFTKPTPGTGASLLSDACSAIVNGHPTPAAALPTNSDEMNKTLLTFMSMGANIIYFDNINAMVDSGELASTITSPTFHGRKLGTNQTVECEVRNAWIFTGNNVQLSAELVRRLTMIDLDAKLAQPELRSNFKHGDLMAWIRENRSKLVWACLTLIQNWIAKGKPLQHDQILNSFENWSRVIGGILRSAGIGGFLENRNQLKEIALSDNDEDIMPLLDMWWEQFGDKPSVVKINKEIPSLSALVEEFEIQLPIKQRRIGESLVYDARPFGQMLKHNRGRVFVLTNGEEVRLEQEETRSRHGMMWSLRSVHSDA